jgi:hypothetical protein
VTAETKSAQFDVVERRLRTILEPYRDRLTVSKEGPDGIYLEQPGYEGKPWGFVAATRIGKAYVSFHLMSAYDPAVVGSISPELKRRMQGKTCFNFTKLDEPLFEELEQVTARGIARHPQLVKAALAARRR